LNIREGSSLYIPNYGGLKNKRNKRKGGRHKDLKGEIFGIQNIW
jgi:hypothetical protein